MLHNLLLPIIFLTAHSISASSFDHHYQGRLKPGDYKFHQSERRLEPELRRVGDLNVDLGIGSDCGNLDIRSTLRGSLNNVLNADYFGDIGRNIVGAAPMLSICYMSPTWCSILKSSRVEANFVAATRLEQCKIIDSYVDSRTQDFQAERQECMRREMGQNGGNPDLAADRCGGSLFQRDFKSWAGPGEGRQEQNSLIDSSARWAGYTRPEDQEMVQFVKAAVGDSLVSSGRVAVRFGPENQQISPRADLKNLKSEAHQILCKEIVPRVLERPSESIYRTISAADRNRLRLGTDLTLIDPPTIRSIASLSWVRRESACRSIAYQMANKAISYKSTKGLEMLTALLQNPHLPDHRRQELELKRQQLRDMVEMTFKLEENENRALAHSLSEVNQEGEAARHQQIHRRFDDVDRDYAQKRAYQALFDCSDGDDIFCDSNAQQSDFFDQ